MSFSGEVQAQEILDALTDGLDFDIPEIDLDDDIYNFPGDANSDLYKPVDRLQNEDLTTRVVDGEGAFDALMAGVHSQLEKELKGNRITGAEYTKAYVALANTAIGASVQFLLQRDTSYWQAQLAQVQAITARVQLQTAKAQLLSAQMDALNNRATYALTVMKLATEDAAYGAAKFQVDEILPIQKQLTQEQLEAARAQTMDTRTNGTAVAGSMGKQQALYSQQIISYQRDAEVKAGKMFLDSWITQKTLDEGLPVPTAFSQTEINEVFQTIKTNNNLD